MAEPRQKPLWERALDSILGTVEIPQRVSPRRKPLPYPEATSMPTLKTPFVMTQLGQGGQELVGVETRNPDRAATQLVISGDVTPMEVVKWEDEAPVGRRVRNFRKNLTSQFEGEDAEFPMVEKVELTPEEEQRRNNAKFYNKERMRLMGLTGDLLKQMSPFGKAATEQLVPERMLRGPGKRFNPSVSDIATDSGDWPRGRRFR